MNPSGSRRWAGVVWLLVVAAAVTAAALGWLQVREQATALANLRAANAALDARVKAMEPQLDQWQAAQDELERLRKQVEEVHRLRGQYQEWQRQKEELARLKAENDRLRAGQAVAAPSAAAKTAPAAWVGVAMGAQTGNGVLVQAAVPGGPAAAAGLVAGDVITALDGRPVAGPVEFRAAIAVRPPGTTVTLDFIRSDTPMRAVLTTAAFPN
jgi:C-terminal processing protease CtpA/Prc